jgi:hypothetical protein
MASWTLTAQLTSGTLVVGTTDRIWVNGTLFGDNLQIGTYQDSTHVASATDTHLCTTAHVNNTKYLGASTVSINGAGSSALPIPTASCGLKYRFSHGSAVATSLAKYYWYDGVTDSNPMAGVTVRAAEGGVSVAWVIPNGSAAALALADQAAATDHDFFIAVSASPTTSGQKAGKVKLLLTYV